MLSLDIFQKMYMKHENADQMCSLFLRDLSGLDPLYYLTISLYSNIIATFLGCLDKFCSLLMLCRVHFSCVSYITIVFIFKLCFAGYIRAPKWYKRKAGVSFGFGGKLVTFSTTDSGSSEVLYRGRVSFVT